MPLTHVCEWKSQIGYRRISIEEACQKYSYGVPASKGFFVCELCAQNVLLTAPGVNARHFRHDSASPNKECDDRQAYFDPTYGRSLKALNSYAVPLRLLVTGSTFSLQLGFFRPPDEGAHCDKIRVVDDSKQIIAEYSFGRIERIGTTYLNVGSIPSKTYNLQYINANAALERFWSKKIQGISATGSFFDGRTGRILQPGGRAYAGELYYLLQRRKLAHDSTDDIDATEITNIQTGSFSMWHLYRIRIKQFSKNSARFFLKYAIFLTEKPTKFYPIWPPYIEDPYFIYHNSSQFYLYLCGDDAELKSYPATASATSTHDGRLYKLYTREREQLISIGKSGALGFSYLIKQPLSKRAPLPSVTIYDHAGNLLTEEAYSKIPKSKLISVSCQYDGKAVVHRAGTVVRVYRLSAEQNLIIDELTFGTEIHFYQGCDCVRSIRFEQEDGCIDISAADEALVEKLKSCSGPMIPVTHAVGALAGKYVEYPKTKQWLYKALRQGEISRKALLLLKGNTLNNYGRDNDV